MSWMSQYLKNTQSKVQLDGPRAYYIALLGTFEQFLIKKPSDLSDCYQWGHQC